MERTETFRLDKETKRTIRYLEVEHEEEDDTPIMVGQLYIQKAFLQPEGGEEWPEQVIVTITVEE